MKTHFAGLDIGGSTIKCMLVDAAGETVGEIVEVPSLVKEGYRKTFGQLRGALDMLAANAGIEVDAIAAVGLDVPAPCSNGVVWGKANLGDDWVGTDIRGGFSADIGKPVFMTNDCNAAAFGEWMYRPSHEGGLLYVAPGTGLGGGMVMPGGILFEGTNGLALEVGDLSVPRFEDGVLPIDGRGREGCLEGWVSLMALRRQLGKALARPENAGHVLAKSDAPIAEKAFQLRDFAEQGDELALSIFALQANVLGHGLGDLASILDPGLVTIGGGLAETKFRDWFLDEVRKGFVERAMLPYQRCPLPPHPQTTIIEWAVGGDAAAAYGSARKAMELVLQRPH
ncbi:MAG: ROK family protein [Akkermansiaceae bacterium]|nr:ROK family protein [Akkermansiaceae bacterium]MCP5546265.1 ROK family protein [Akkermansiaceae bacterium]